VARPTTGDEAVKAGKNDKKRMKTSKVLMVILLQERLALLCTHAERLPQHCGSANPQFTMSKHMSPQWLSSRLLGWVQSRILDTQVFRPGWAGKDPEMWFMAAAPAREIDCTPRWRRKADASS
jgi:hypothetical protein